MRSTLFPRLFSPITINKLVLPNRVLMNAMHLGLEASPDMWEAMECFYTRRARGSIGLMVTGGCSPNLAGRALANGFSLHEDGQIVRHRQITSAVHREAGRIALQLAHFGRESFHGELVSASACRAHNNIYVPKVLDEAAILQTIDDYAVAAVRAREAGYDAVEILGSQGFLPHQFLSRWINQRTDQWNGDLAHRARLLMEILRAVRRRVGDDYPLLLRLPSLDLMPDANSREEVGQLLHWVRDCGVDLINLGVGTHGSAIQSTSMHVPRAGFSAVAAFLKHHARGLPISVSNRINSPELAEELLAAGIADMVSLGRAFLADPDFLLKAAAGQLDDLNRCIACNQACLDQALFGMPTRCTVNPVCNAPEETASLPSGVGKRFTVVGGGIAGMACASYLADAGCEVELYEAEDRLGGQMLAASRLVGKQEFKETLRYFHHRLNRANVTLRLGRKWQVDEVAADNLNGIIIATGSKPLRLHFDVNDGSVPFYHYDEVLSGHAPIHYPAIVVGSGGVAVDLACHLMTRPRWQQQSSEYLARYLPPEESAILSDSLPHQQRVLLLQRNNRGLARKVGATTRKTLIGKLDDLGVEVLSRTRIQAIQDGQVVLVDDQSLHTAIAAGCIIAAIGQRPDDSLLDELRARDIPAWVIGAANANLNGHVNLTSSIKSAHDLSHQLLTESSRDMPKEI